MVGACRDGSPGTLSDLRSASVNNTRLASVVVLHQIHTFVRHCSSPLFHDIGLFVEQLQQALSEQEKKIVEQQKLLREQQQRQAEPAAGEAAGQEGSDITMTDDQTCRKQKASEEDLNDSPAKRTRSSSSDSLARHNSSSPHGESASEAAPAATGDKRSESAAEAFPTASDNMQSSDEPTQLTSAQPALATQAQPTQLEPGQLEPGTEAEPAQIGSAQAEPLTGEPDAAAVFSTQQAGGDCIGDKSQLKPAESDLAATPADCAPVGSGTQPVKAPAAATSADERLGAGGADEGGTADTRGGIKDVGAGVEHPLGGPKPDKPKRRKKFTKDSVRVCASSLHN